MAAASNKVEIVVVNQTTREVKGSNNLVPLTDEVYDKLSYGNQLLVALHDKYVGTLTDVVKYTNGFGIAQANLEAIGSKLKIG